VGKLEPNLVADLKMVRSSIDGDKLEELDYVNTPSPDYTVEDLVKMISFVKNPDIKGGRSNI
jgi:hypothetical protein